GVADGLAGAVDVRRVAPRQAADDRPLDLAGDGLHRLEVARRRDGETRLDDVHAEVAQAVGYLEPLGQAHAGAGALPAVARRGAEDKDAVVGHRGSPKQKSPGWSQGRTWQARRSNAGRRG